MKRDDWQLRFSAFARERAAMPFAWGTNDCCLFAADAVEAMTGADFGADARGAYQDARGALEMMAGRGGLHAVATAALGPAIAPVFATIGDVILMTNEGRELLAICNGTTAVGPGAEGLVVIDMETAIAAWRV